MREKEREKENWNNLNLEKIYKFSLNYSFF